MNRTSKLITSFVLIQGIWFACVWSGAQGLAWPAVLAAVAGLAYHLGIAGNRRLELAFTALAVGLGLVGDSVLTMTGVLAFPAYPDAGLAPVFMLGLWVNFAGAFVLCLEWMRGRYLLGAALGFIGGPLAYYSGTRLGAVTLADPLPGALLAVGIEWAIAMPLLMISRERLFTSSPTISEPNGSHANA